jgi:hypothetical protein
VQDRAALAESQHSERLGFGVALVPELTWQISLAHGTSEQSPLVRELVADLRAHSEA